jgi:hypothetical protein
VVFMVSGSIHTDNAVAHPSFPDSAQSCGATPHCMRYAALYLIDIRAFAPSQQHFAATKTIARDCL